MAGTDGREERDAQGRQKDNVWLLIGRYTSLAFALPVTAGVGYLIGHLLDRAFGTSFLSVVFLLLGIVGGFLQLFRELNRDTKGG